MNAIEIKLISNKLHNSKYNGNYIKSLADYIMDSRMENINFNILELTRIIISHKCHSYGSHRYYPNFYYCDFCGNSCKYKHTNFYYELKHVYYGINIYTLDGGCTTNFIITNQLINVFSSYKLLLCGLYDNNSSIFMLLKDIIYNIGLSLIFLAHA